MKLEFFEPKKSLNSRIGFGTWGLGGNAYGYISEKNAQKLIEYAFSLGIVFFDTAPLYGNGRSESILGKTFSREKRDSFKVLTKAGLHIDEGGDEIHGFNHQSLLESLEKSLERLQLDKLDLFLMHSPTSKQIEVNAKYSFGFGNLDFTTKFDKFGISLKSPFDFEKAIQVPNLEAVEFNFSLMDQRAKTNKSRLMSSSGIFKLARTPFNFGFLTSKPPIKAELKNNHHLNSWPSNQFERWSEARIVWQKIADKNSINLEHLALIFILSHEEIDMVIPGFMSTEQIDSAIKVSEYGLLTPDSLEKCYRIFEEMESKGPLVKKSL